MSVTVVVDVGNAHVKVCGRTAAGDLARRTGSSSVWAGPGTLRSGAAAEKAAEDSPEHLVVGWVERLGEEVPFHTEAGTLTVEQLLREVLHEPLAEVARDLGQPVERVALLTPDEWSPVRRRRVRAAVEEALSGSAVEVLPRAVGLRQSLAEVAERESQLGGVLVIDVGASAVRARVLAPDGDLSRPVVETGVGGDLLDDRVFRHVLDQIPPALRAPRGTPDGRRELARTRRACRNARDRLSSETETTVPVRLASAASELRLVRPEIESLLDDDLHRILDVGQRAVDAGRAPLSRVVLLGGCAHTPRLAQLASARWSCPVDRPDDPSSFALVSALEVLEREAATADRAGTSTALAAPEEDRAVEAAAAPMGAAVGSPDEHAAAGLVPPSAGGRPATPEWLPGGGGGAHLTSPRRRLQPALLAAASALVLAGGAGVAMTFLPDMDPAGAVTRIVTRTEPEPARPDLPGVFVPGPWAPGAAPTVPVTEDKGGADGPSEAQAAAPERFLPGVPALPLAAAGEALAAPGAPGSPATVAGRSGPGGRTSAGPSGTTPGTSGTTTPGEGAVAGGSTTSPTSPGTSAPGTAAPGTTAPGTSAPGTTAPGTTTPGTVEPEPTTPGTVEPEPTTPGTVEPEPTTPGTVEPEPTTPGTVEPEPEPDPGPDPTDPGPGDTTPPAGPGASTAPEPADPGEGDGASTPGSTAGDPAPGDGPADPTP